MTTATAIRAHIRWMIRRDMVEVLDIENLTEGQRWNEEKILFYLRNRNVIGMVAEIKKQVVGYFIYELHKDSLHLVRFIVHPDHRRRSLFTQMIDKLKGKLSPYHRLQVVSIVSQDNLSAHLALKANGFIGSVSGDSYKFVYSLQPGEYFPD